MPAARVRFFLYASLPLVQHYDADAQVDQWRAGLGVIYSFDRPSETRYALPPASRW
jgi:hypothetical protein